MVNLVELQISTNVTWKEAQALADREAGGLPTREDFIRSGINLGDINLWMPTRHADGRVGEYCQLGKCGGPNKAIYISHEEQWGKMDGGHWSFNNDYTSWRPGPNAPALKGIIYAMGKKGKTN